MKGRNEVNKINWLGEITLQVKRSPENGREGTMMEKSNKKDSLKQKFGEKFPSP